jgi:outer membrane protein assembly factor BamA
MFALPFLLFVVSWAQSPPPASQQIVVRNVTLNGASQLSASEQQQIIRELQKSYGIISFGHINNNLREALQDHGFYKASTSQPKVTVVSGTETSGTVDVAFDISEGQRYRLKDISFSNNHAFTPKELRRAFSVSNGDVFSTAEARRGFEALRRLYVSHGYIDFVPFPELIVDEQSAFITMQVDLSEGVPFRVGKLAFDGEASTPEAAAKLRDGWRKYEGRVYSNDIMPTYVRENASYLPQSETDTQLFRITVDEDAHVLHFRLELKPSAPSPEP